MNNKKFWISLVAGAMALIMVLGLILGLLASTVGAASSGEIEKQIESLQNANQQMQEKIEALDNLKTEDLSDIEKLISEKSVIEQQISLLQSQISNISEQFQAYAALIADKQVKVDTAETYFLELKGKTLESILALKLNDTDVQWIQMFESDSFTEILSKLNAARQMDMPSKDMLEEACQMMKELISSYEALKLARMDLQSASGTQATLQAALEERQSELYVLQSKLAAKASELDKLMAESVQDQIRQEQSLKDTQTEHENTDAHKEDPVCQENLKYLGPGKRSNVGIKGGVGGSVKIDEDGVIWVVPCDYRKLSSAFGYRTHPVYGYKQYHTGADLDADCLMYKDGTTDSPIYATRKGVVTAATYNSSSGYYVSIDHGDGFESVYLHMCCMPFVKVGDEVVAGQIIGCIGRSGTATGEHLHFGLYKDGKRVDPMDYIG